MRSSALFALVLVVGCGARTDLEVEAEPSAPPGPCQPEAPEAYEGLEGVVLAADVTDVWLALPGGGFEIAHADATSGALQEVVARDQFATRSAVATGGQLFWASAGRSSFAGVVARADRSGGMEILAEGLFQPGALEHDGARLYFAEWTNSGRLADEMRGRVLAIDPGGGGLTELATGLGLPTDTALVAGHVYWVDRRRDHVARVPTSGGAVEIVADAPGVWSALGGRGSEVFFATMAGRNQSELFALDADTLELRSLTVVDREIRGIVAVDGGLLMSLWDSSVGGASIGWHAFGRDGYALLDEDAARVVVDAQRAYWSGGAGPSRIARVCLPYLQTL